MSTKEAVIRAAVVLGIGAVFCGFFWLFMRASSVMVYALLGSVILYQLWALSGVLYREFKD